MGLQEVIQGNFDGMSPEEMIKALTDYFGYTEEQATNMLVDMGEIEPGWCEG